VDNALANSALLGLVGAGYGNRARCIHVHALHSTGNVAPRWRADRAVLGLAGCDRNALEAFRVGRNALIDRHKLRLRQVRTRDPDAGRRALGWRGERGRLAAETQHNPRKRDRTPVQLCAIVIRGYW
jgi:hypothetical protein